MAKAVSPVRSPGCSAAGGGAGGGGVEGDVVVVGGGVCSSCLPTANTAVQEGLAGAEDRAFIYPVLLARPDDVFSLLLLLSFAIYTVSPISKMNWAVFCRSSLHPYSFVCSAASVVGQVVLLRLSWSSP